MCLMNCRDDKPVRLCLGDPLNDEKTCLHSSRRDPISTKKETRRGKSSPLYRLLDFVTYPQTFFKSWREGFLFSPTLIDSPGRALGPEDLVGLGLFRRLELIHIHTLAVNHSKAHGA